MRQQEVFHGYSAQLLATLLGDSEIGLPVTSTSSFQVKNLPGITIRQKVALQSKTSAEHPLYPKMKLLAVYLSRKASETQTFEEKLQMLLQICGEQPPLVRTNQFSGNGLFMEFHGTRIPVLHM